MMKDAFAITLFTAEHFELNSRLLSSYLRFDPTQ